MTRRKKVEGKGKEKEKEMGRKEKVLCSNFLPTKAFHLRERLIKIPHKAQEAPSCWGEEILTCWVSCKSFREL